MTTEWLEELINQRVQSAVETALQQSQPQQLTLLQVLNQLSETTKQLALNVQASAVATQSQNITVRAITSNIERPTFKQGASTTAYLTQIQSYLMSQGIKEKDFVSAARAILPEDMRPWYDFNCPSFTDWAAFKKEFASRHDGFEEQNQQRTILQNKRQDRDQPTEPFIYEYIALSRACYPDEGDEEHMGRLRNALWPRLKSRLPLTFPDIKTLVHGATQATRNLEDEDRTDRVYPYNVPPMRMGERNGDDSAGPNNYSPSRENTNDERGEDRGNGNSTPAATSWHSSDQGVNNSESDNWREDEPTTTKEEEESFWQTEDRSTTQSGETEDADNHDYTDKSTNPNISLERCRNCRGYGHFSDTCPSSEGVAFALAVPGVHIVDEAPEDGTQAPYYLN